jgi:hypothetical protein
MAPQDPVPAPGRSLNVYQTKIQDLLDAFKKGELSWAEMMDRREQAVAQLNGRLIDHFLVRAHNVRSLNVGARRPSSPTGR